MPASIDQQIKERIEDFVSELDALVRQAAVESVSQALGRNSTHRERATRAAPAVRVRGRRKGEKRSSNELASLTVRLRDYIAKNPGSGIEQIGKAIGSRTKELALPVKKLVAEKAIRTRGVKRATKYFAT
jgi:hypothetical protein